jgi:hypothetical protein
LILIAIEMLILAIDLTFFEEYNEPPPRLLKEYLSSSSLHDPLTGIRTDMQKERVDELQGG